MRVIEVKSCRECPWMHRGGWTGEWFCRATRDGNGKPDFRELIPKRHDSVPKFCPLKEAKS